jgi:hypothetical protein
MTYLRRNPVPRIPAKALFRSATDRGALTSTIHSERSG